MLHVFTYMYIEKSGKNPTKHRVRLQYQIRIQNRPMPGCGCGGALVYCFSQAFEADFLPFPIHLVPRKGPGPGNFFSWAILI